MKPMTSLQIARELNKRCGVIPVIHPDGASLSPSYGELQGCDAETNQRLLLHEEIYSPRFEPNAVILGIMSDSPFYKHLGLQNGVLLYIQNFAPGCYVPGNSSAHQPAEDEAADLTIMGLIID